jgi:hypothetical protein
MRPKDVRKAIEDALDSPEPVQPLFLWGAPGIGKSAVPREICRERQITLVDIRMSLLDPTDLRGIPAVVDEACSRCKGSGGENRDCPVCGGTGLRTVAKWLEPAMLPTDGKGILFFDELTSAPPLQQATAYQVTLDRRIGEYKVPDGFYIIAAGNNQTDRAVVYPMSTALRNRFTHIEFAYHIDDWLVWAREAGINPNIVAFLTWRGGELLFNFKPESTDKAFATPRSWEFASRILNRFTPSLQRELLDGTIGSGAAAEFVGFLKLQEQIPSIEKILAGEIIVPKDIGLKYALVSALVGHCEIPRHYDRLLQYSFELPKEFAVLLVQLLVSRNVAMTVAAPTFSQWQKKYQDVLLTK